MKLSDEWFNHTLIHPKYKDVYDIAFYSGMQAAVNIFAAKGSAEEIRLQIVRDTNRDPTKL